MRHWITSFRLLTIRPVYVVIRHKGKGLRNVSEPEASTLGRRNVIEDAVRRLAPCIPHHELGAVTDHALDSTGLRGAAPETAAWLSLVAYVRHVLTDYDALLAEGHDVDSARFFVREDIEAVLGEWGVRRPLTEAEEAEG